MDETKNKEEKRKSDPHSLAKSILILLAVGSVIYAVYCLFLLAIQGPSSQTSQGGNTEQVMEIESRFELSDTDIYNF